MVHRTKEKASEPAPQAVKLSLPHSSKSEFRLTKCVVRPANSLVHDAIAQYALRVRLSTAAKPPVCALKLMNFKHLNACVFGVVVNGYADTARPKVVLWM